jgi:hypothetical protein
LAADLTTNWISLLTNAAPFTFTQSNASSFSQRFYHLKIWWENLGLKAKAGAERFIPAFFMKTTCLIAPKLEKLEQKKVIQETPQTVK